MAEFGYDTEGKLTSFLTPNGYASQLTYDAKNNLQTITDNAGRSLSLEYDANGYISEMTDSLGRVTTFSSDALGNLLSYTPPGRPAHNFLYTASGLEREYRPPVLGAGTPNVNTIISYGLLGKETQIQRPDGTVIDLAYDTGGRLMSQTYPAPAPLPPSTRVVSYAHDAEGKLISTSAPDISLIHEYELSRLTSSTWSGTVSGQVSFNYDKADRLISQQVNAGPVVTFDYDAGNSLTEAGALTLHRNPQDGTLTGTTLGAVIDSLTYDAFGQSEVYQASAGATPLLNLQYTRDVRGLIRTITETMDSVTVIYEYTYDTAGQLTEIKRDGTVVATYVYGVNGNRTTITTDTGTISPTYDDHDRLLSHGNATYAYTANGELSSKTVGAQTTTYGYGALGNLLAVNLPDGSQIEYLVDGENRRVGKQVNGALVQGFLYQDKLNPIAELDGSGNVVARFVYGTKDHVPDYMVKGGVTYRWIHDHLGSPRLVVDTSTGNVVQRLDYDVLGNITLDTNPGFQPFGFSGGLYDQDTRLTRFGVRDYDAETGRWTAKDPLRFDAGDSNLYGYVLNDPVNKIDPTGTREASLNTKLIIVSAILILTLVTAKGLQMSRLTPTIGPPERPPPDIPDTADPGFFFAGCVGACKAKHKGHPIRTNVCIYLYCLPLAALLAIKSMFGA